MRRNLVVSMLTLVMLIMPLNLMASGMAQSDSSINTERPTLDSLQSAGFSIIGEYTVESAHASLQEQNEVLTGSFFVEDRLNKDPEDSTINSHHVGEDIVTVYAQIEYTNINYALINRKAFLKDLDFSSPLGDWGLNDIYIDLQYLSLFLGDFIILQNETITDVPRSYRIVGDSLLCSPNIFIIDNIWYANLGGIFNGDEDYILNALSTIPDPFTIEGLVLNADEISAK